MSNGLRHSRRRGKQLLIGVRTTMKYGLIVAVVEYHQRFMRKNKTYTMIFKQILELKIGLPFGGDHKHVMLIDHLST